MGNSLEASLVWLRRHFMQNRTVALSFYDSMTLQYPRVGKYIELLLSCSVMSNSLRPHGLQHARFPCPSLSPRVSLNFMSIESVMLFNHLILSSPSPPAFSLSQHRVFSNELAFHIRWPKCWSFSFSISSSNEYSGLISFRIDWYDLLAIQGTLKSLLQHRSSKTSILRPSTCFMIQLSHLYMTTGKTIALTRWAFVGKLMSAFQYAV